MGPSKMVTAAIFWLNFLNNRSSIQSVFEIVHDNSCCAFAIHKLKDENVDFRKQKSSLGYFLK